MSNTEIVELVVDAALVVAWIAVVVLPLLPLARKTAQIEKLTVKPETVASADREGRTNGVIDDEHARDQSLLRIAHEHTLMRRLGTTQKAAIRSRKKTRRVMTSETHPK